MRRYHASARKMAKGLQVDVHTRGIHARLDEPKSGGGTNTGMNPVEMELCSLGTSLQETAARLAADQTFSYQKMTVNLEGDLDPAGFMGKDPNVRNGFQEIRLALDFETQATQAECEAFADWVEAACPMAQMLRHGVKVSVDKVEVI